MSYPIDHRRFDISAVTVSRKARTWLNSWPVARWIITIGSLQKSFAKRRATESR